jgi:hypothetical protein
MMKAGLSLRVVSVLLWTASALAGQQQGPVLEPGQPHAPAVPVVTFTFDWPSVQPHHYSISVDSTGSAAYQSRIAQGTASQSIEGDPYMVKFEVSAPVRSRIFQLARDANYFNGNFEYKKHKIAFSGNKTLAYSDFNQQHETSYNWSENPAIQQLTTIFEGISNTQEAGRRLEQLRRYDKLGLDAELENMEQMEHKHSLLELRSIAPILQEIAADPSVMNVARERAQRLLQAAK